MSIHEKTTLDLAKSAIKRIALDARCRKAFAESSLFKDLFSEAAGKYIIAADSDLLMQRLPLLESKGYLLGIEFAGEENLDTAIVDKFTKEYIELLNNFSALETPPQIGFDLSAVGLMLSPKVAFKNTEAILNLASAKKAKLMLSMERSNLVDSTLRIFKQLAPLHEHIGITLQAQLHRTSQDLSEILNSKRKIRLVKGVYNETCDVALPRSTALDDRYIKLAEMIIKSDCELAIATHDQKLIERLETEGLLTHTTEVEMLHGVQPNLLASLKRKGITCRIATVYGNNWFLHFLHRLAESPENLISSLADFYAPNRVIFARDY